MLNAVQSSTLNSSVFRMLNMKLLSERLAHIYAERPDLEGERGQQGFIKASGASKSVVNQWLNDKIKSIDIRYALAIERNLGFSHIWLMTGEGSPRVSNIRALHPDDPLPEDVVAVPESRVEFSAGPGREPHYELEEQNEPATYRLSWFQKQQINPDRVKRFRVTGDSQEDFLYHNDTVLVNLDETNIVDGKLYAIRYGNDLRIKFIFKKLDGTLVLHSRNPLYPDEEISPELANEHISIIGRVRDKSGKGGL
jgi:phage repressor protein C with HTH and peptisase S24 domain